MAFLAALPEIIEAGAGAGEAAGAAGAAAGGAGDAASGILRAAGAAGSAGGGQQQGQQQKPPGLLWLHNGGVVPGNPADGDSRLAMLQPGERVTPVPPDVLARARMDAARYQTRTWSTPGVSPDVDSGAARSTQPAYDDRPQGQPQMNITDDGGQSESRWHRATRRHRPKRG